MKLRPVLARSRGWFQFACAMFGIAGVFFVNQTAHAASGTWINNNSSTWSTTTNWAGSPGVVADGATFTGDFSTIDITATRTVTIDGAVASRTLGILKMGDTTGASHYVIAATGSGTLTFDNGGSNAQLNETSTAQGDIINSTVPILLNDSLDINNASGFLLTISGTVTGNGAAGTKTIHNLGGGAGGVSFSSTIADGGSGQVIAINQDSATSSFSISGTNSFSGGTTLTAGTLTMSSGNAALGSGTITFSGGALVMNASPTNNVAVTNSTVSSLTIGANRALGAAGGTFTGGGTLNVNLGGFLLTESTPLGSFSGTLNFGSSVAGSIFLFNLATNTGSSTATFDLGSGATTVRASSTAGTNKTVNLGGLSGGASTILEAGATTGVETDTYSIGGTGLSTQFDGTIRNGVGSPTPHTTAITKTGAGTLTLTGANTYTGATTVSGGSLAVSGASAKLGVSNVSVASTAVNLTIQTGVLDAIDDTKTLSLAGGGTAGVADNGFASLGSGVSETVAALILAGVTQGFGTYGSTSSGATFQNNEFFSGTGIVNVVPEPGTCALMLSGVGMLFAVQRLRRRS